MELVQEGHMVGLVLEDKAAQDLRMVPESRRRFDVQQWVLVEIRLFVRRGPADEEAQDWVLIPESRRLFEVQQKLHFVDPETGD